MGNYSDKAKVLGMRIRMVTDRTGLMDFGDTMVPFYHLFPRDIVLLDSGYERFYPEMSSYFWKEDLHVRAIINSHVHEDHVGCNRDLMGDHDLSQFFSVAESMEFQDYVREIGGPDDEYRIEIEGLLRPLTGHVTDITDQDYISLDGQVFRLIDLPGHSWIHKGIITPDDVCYLGDALLTEDVLKKSRLPYAFNKKREIESKSRILGMKHRAFLMAHSGFVTGDEIDDLVRRNLAHDKKILKLFTRTAEGLSDPYDDEAAPVYAKALGIRLSVCSDADSIIMLRWIMEYAALIGDRETEDLFVRLGIEE